MALRRTTAAAGRPFGGQHMGRRAASCGLARMAAIVAPLFLAAPAAAVNPDEMLADPALEERARDLSANLRCMVCQNQSIDDSNAPLARDLRILVRERIEAGDSDDEVIEFLVARYGEFVLLTPRMSAATIALWAAPVVLLVLGGGLALMLFRRHRADVAPPPAPLSDDEKAELERLLAAGNAARRD